MYVNLPSNIYRIHAAARANTSFPKITLPTLPLVCPSYIYSPPQAKMADQTCRNRDGEPKAWQLCLHLMDQEGTFPGEYPAKLTV